MSSLETFISSLRLQLSDDQLEVLFKHPEEAIKLARTLYDLSVRFRNEFTLRLETDRPDQLIGQLRDSGVFTDVSKMITDKNLPVLWRGNRDITFRVIEIVQGVDVKYYSQSIGAVRERFKKEGLRFPTPDEAMLPFIKYEPLKSLKGGVVAYHHGSDSFFRFRLSAGGWHLSMRNTTESSLLDRYPYVLGVVQ